MVPGDILVVSEGQKISADARIIAGEVEVSLSTLTGESAPTTRSGEAVAASVPPLEAADLLFSGTVCLAGTCRAVVVATGDHTELGRIAALSQVTVPTKSPLEQQVTRIARLIAVVAVAAGLAFLPLGLLAGLSFTSAFLFAIGLLVANVPEGLLPTITLALAVGVRRLAARGAIVKRLSAVQTLGSTTVICTDKTGTLTWNRMSAVAIGVAGRQLDVSPDLPPDPDVDALATALVSCAITTGTGVATSSVDPTEQALWEAAHTLVRDGAERSVSRRLHVYPFHSEARMSSTVDDTAHGVTLNVKGAPEAVLARSVCLLDRGTERALEPAQRSAVEEQVSHLAARGLRVLAVARRSLPDRTWPKTREQAEHDLCLLGLVALLDPPRPEVREAVRICHEAGLRVIVITGDNPETAREIAREVGIGDAGVRTVTGAQVDNLSDAALTVLLQPGQEVICSRSSPEDKIRIAAALQAHDEVVAMTGDGVNDAPALRRADIGVAMGRSGTDVAREAATVVLTDDNFSTIVVAIEEGRRIFDNVRKFIVYIFAHAVPEVVPFLVFALSGGRIPLPLTVLQILAIDLGTETLPALALAREPAEPGIMAEPPRARHGRLVTGQMLLRAWALLGVTSAALTMAAYFFTLQRGGWYVGAPTGPGTPLHQTYLEATTASFAAIVACQVGTALASRTERVSLLRIGPFSNRLLLGGIAFELVFSAALIYVPVLNELLRTAPLPAATLLFIAPFPVVVWGVDELYRAVRRRSVARVADPGPVPTAAREA
ncbi:cation-translocating P-type ATPase [Nocardioides mesophilus]|uniref:cation-translocating P-type ATPase n=1 Tax=Nocardioides mesophilus TaxID=433659 RepID=UPI001FEB47F2|nr:cation-transporting P-type ATPase [Nocardioides mesophilus]